MKACHTYEDNVTSKVLEKLIDQLCVLCQVKSWKWQILLTLEYITNYTYGFIAILAIIWWCYEN